MSSTNLNSLTSAELRKKLLEYGKDLPTSVSKEFQIKVLQKVMKEPAKIKLKRSPSPVHDEPECEPDPVPLKRKRPTISSNSVAPNSPAAPTGRKSYGGGMSIPTRTSSTRTTRYSLASPANETFRTQPSSDEEEEEFIPPPPPVVTKGRPSSPRRSISKQREQPVEEKPPKAFPNRVNRASIAKNIKTPANEVIKTLSPQQQATNTSQWCRTNFEQKNVMGAGEQPSYSNMFGLVISGRMVQTDFLPNQTTNPTKFRMDIVQADAVEHIVVFLSGSQLFPQGFGGQVYYGWTNDRTQKEEWHLLGHITNDRPSRIFKLTEFRNHISALSQEIGSLSCDAQLGISIELVNVILDSYHYNPDTML